MIIPSSKEMYISSFPEWQPHDEEISDSMLKVYPEYAPTAHHLCDELYRMDKEEEIIQSDKDDIQEAQARYIEKRFDKYKKKQSAVAFVSGALVGGITVATGGAFAGIVAGVAGVATLGGVKYTLEDVIFKNNVHKFNCEARARGYGKARIDRLKDKIRKLDLTMKDPGFLVGKTEDNLYRSKVQCKKALSLLQARHDKFLGLWQETIVSIGIDKSLFGIPKAIKQGAGKDKYNMFSFYIKDTQTAVIKSTRKPIEFYQYDSDGVSKFSLKTKIRTQDPLLEREDRLMPYKKERLEYPEESYFASENIFSLFLSREHERGLERIEEENETDNLIMRLDASIRKHRKDDVIELTKRPVDEMREEFEKEFVEHKERSFV